MNDLEHELAELLEQVVAAWNRLDFAALEALWDPDESRPFYLPEEAPSALTSWEALREYWTGTRRVTRALSMRVWNLEAKPIAADLAVALWQMHWNADVEGYERPVGGDNRVTAIFRRRGDRWRFIHYVEAPLAPILYLKRFYERDVDPDFPVGKNPV
ncbi:MAG TPA: nuclear transport factor 2 family protein [Steroidobacteraceae bacterium]|nr:nuclear transport factor 2 family protein [Steroidobacteraceae bacterium]